MKKLLYIFAVILTSMSFTLFASCDDDDDQKITMNDLPASAQSFVTDHFSSATVNQVLKNATGYDVAMSGYKVEFDNLGNWVEIEAHNDGALPASVLSLVPRSIVNYVNQYYSNRNISEISVETYGYDIDLSGNPDVDLMFDTLGNYLGKDGENSDQKIEVSALPQVAQTFLSTYFANEKVSFAERDDNEYSVKFANKVEVDFGINGEWKKVDANGNTLSPTVIGLLPSTAVSYINTNYAGKRIEDIEKKAYTYEVEIYNNIDLVFDMQGNIWGTSTGGGNNSGNEGRVDFATMPQIAQNYVNTHFAGIKVLYVEKDSDDYEVKLADGSEVSFDLAGNFESMDVLRSAGVPESAVLPAVLSYVKTNFSGKVIMEYSKNLRGYKVELSGYPEIELLFNLDGGFLGRD